MIDEIFAVEYHRTLAKLAWKLSCTWIYAGVCVCVHSRKSGFTIRSATCQQYRRELTILGPSSSIVFTSPYTSHSFFLLFFIFYLSFSFFHLLLSSSLFSFALSYFTFLYFHVHPFPRLIVLLLSDFCLLAKVENEREIFYVFFFQILLCLFSFVPTVL